jgi:hypothetical protein
MSTKPEIVRALAPVVPFTLEIPSERGGTRSLSFRLSYNFNAYALIEKYTRGSNQEPGLDMLKGLRIWATLNATNLQIIFWAALRQEHPQYASDDGLDAVGTLLNLSNSAAASDACFEAWILTLEEERRVAIRKLIENRREAEDASGNPPTTTA